MPMKRDKKGPLLSRQQKTASSTCIVPAIPYNPSFFDGMFLLLPHYIQIRGYLIATMTTVGLTLSSKPMKSNKLTFTIHTA